MDKILKRELSKIVFVVVFPWLVLFLYNLFGLDTKGGFFERYETTIKTTLLSVSGIGSCFVVFEKIHNNHLKTVSNFILVLLLILIAVVSFLAAIFVYGFRHGVGF